MSIPKSLLILNALTELDKEKLGDSRIELATMIDKLLNKGLINKIPSEILFYHKGFEAIGQHNLKTINDLENALKEMSNVLKDINTAKSSWLFQLLLNLHQKALACKLYEY